MNFEKIRPKRKNSYFPIHQGNTAIRSGRVCPGSAEVGSAGAEIKEGGLRLARLLKVGKAKGRGVLAALVEPILCTGKSMRIRTKKGNLLSISRAKKENIREILELQYSAYQSEAALLNNYDIPPLKQTFEDIESEFSKSVFLKVTDENNKIVGSVRGCITEGTLFIGKLIVAPEMQGQGIGTKLLEEIERINECSRCELFTSSKSVRNIGLYERVGYSVFKEEQISDGLSFIYLQKVKKE